MKNFLSKTAIGIISALIISGSIARVSDLTSKHLGFSLFRMVRINIEIVDPSKLNDREGNDDNQH